MCKGVILLFWLWVMERQVSWIFQKLVKKKEIKTVGLKIKLGLVAIKIDWRGIYNSMIMLMLFNLAVWKWEKNLVYLSEFAGTPNSVCLLM